MNRLKISIFTIFLIGITGCQDFLKDLERKNPRDPKSTVLEINLSTDKTEYNSSDLVHLELKVKNISQENVIFYGASTSNINHFYIKKDGNLIWPTGNDIWAPGIIDYTIEPDEIKIFTDTWDKKDNNGDDVSGNVEVYGTFISIRKGPVTISLNP